MRTLDNYPCPLIAILRGLTASEAPIVGATLFEAGFRLIEVPLNRPGALKAIAGLRRIAPPDAMIGAGTVLTTEEVDAVKDAGGQFVVSPNCASDVILQTKYREMLSFPGIATPTEAFQALMARADALKLFPAEMMPPTVVKAFRSILPADTLLLPVGGITPNNMAAYIDAGANGFGIGGQLYWPGMEISALKRGAEAFITARVGLVGK